MEEKRTLGREIIVSSNLIKRGLSQTAEFDQLEHLTGTHGWVIKYLYDNRERDVFQRDIESEFSIRRSTVTGILQCMEKNELIERQSVENDARLKKLVLTNKAIQIQCKVEETIAEFEKNLSDGITQEEREVFFRVTEKIRQNLGE